MQKTKKIKKCSWIYALLLFTMISTKAQAQRQPADLVNVFTGTSNSRWQMFPGPTMPFGMVKLSPDNQSNVWNGGYEYHQQYQWL